MKPGPYPSSVLTALAGIVVAITVTVASAALLMAEPRRSDVPSARAPTSAAVWREPRQPDPR